MKNQYFGDVNDYRKYGLLRCVAEATDRPVGVHWCLTSNDTRKDGEFRAYMREPGLWRRHDPTLFDSLRQLLEPTVVRDVQLAESWNLLPGSRFFSALVPREPTSRTSYLATSMEVLARHEFVFLDPDNGVEVKSRRFGTKHSPKYIYWRELEGLFAQGHSLLVYQHYPHVHRPTFERALTESLQARLGAHSVTLFATSNVGFFLVLQRSHARHLAPIESLVRSRWAGQVFIGGRPAA